MSFILAILTAVQINTKIYLPMNATAYYLHGTTATGTEARAGVCATGLKSLLGKECAIYQRLPNGERGDLIGVYKIEDTGCKPGVIDVWVNDAEECQEFANLTYKDGCKGKIYVELLEAYEE